MDTQNNYITKIANLKEIEEKWNYEKNINDNKELYEKTKNIYIEEVKKGNRIVYIGKLNNQIICDLTAILKEESILNEAKYSYDLVSDIRVHLCGFRTIKEYENKGYFSKLFKYVEEDLKNKGYSELSLSVEEKEERNIAIYKKWGFTNYIRTEILQTKDKQYIFHYYYKKIQQ